MSTYPHFEPQLREFDKNKYLHAHKHVKRQLAKQQVCTKQQEASSGTPQKPTFVLQTFGQLKRDGTR